MKKRIASLLLALCLLFSALSLASCTPVTAQALFTEAMTRTEALDSIDASVVMSMSMKIPTGIGDETMDVGMSFSLSMLIQDATGQNMTAKVEGTMTQQYGGEEQSIENTFYVKDNYMYMVEDGEGMKMPLDTDTPDCVAMLDSMNVDLGDLLKDLEITDNADGSKSVTVTIPADKFQTLFDGLIDDVNSSLGGSTDGAEISFSDISMKLTTKDGYIVKQELVYKMSMTVSGQTISTDISMTATYKNIGQAVTVTMPAGYESFTDLSAGS